MKKLMLMLIAVSFLFVGTAPAMAQVDGDAVKSDTSSWWWQSSGKKGSPW